MIPQIARSLLATTATLAVLAGAALADDADRVITPEMVPMADLTAPAPGVAPAGTSSETGVGVQAGMALNLQLDRADGRYRPGETLSMRLSSPRDAHLLVLNTNARGQTTVIYPNRMAPDARIRAGQPLVLPPFGADWLLRVNPPAGPNLITVIATDRPFDLLAGLPSTAEGPFRSIGVGADQLARHLSVEMATQSDQGGFVTAQARFTVTGAQAGLQPVPLQPVQPGAVQPMPVQPQPVQPVDFGLRLQADRLAWRIGESLSVTVSASRDCALTLINVSEPGGAATVLYPNQLVPELRLRAGETIRLPAPGSNLQLQVVGPAGPQSLYARCEADGRATLGQYQGMPLRGVHPVLSLPQWQQISQRPAVATARLGYTVLP